MWWDGGWLCGGMGSGRDGPNKKRHGVQTNQKKNKAILSTNDDFGRKSRFPDNILFGVIF